MDLSEIHSCSKSHGKIVNIRIDYLGQTYCGYCGDKIDYKKYFEYEFENNIKFRRLVEEFGGKNEQERK